jgi:predicted DNA-binding transcriptional regulator YafY
MTDKRTKIEFFDTLLSTRGRYTQEDIIKRYEERFNKFLSRRSFYIYIKALREQGAPLETRTEKDDFGSKTYYYYEEKFNLSQNALNRYDAAKIKSALDVLQQFEHLPQMQDLSEVVLKLEQQMGLQAKMQAPTLFFDHRPLSNGVRWLRRLHNHIVQHDVLKLIYTPFPYDADDHRRWLDTGFEIQVHPYFLKETKKSWHLFGLNQNKNKIENYALDRIEGIEVLPHVFYKPNTQIKGQDYFDDIVGVTKFDEHPRLAYLIKVSRVLAPHWINRPLHTSQKLVEETPQYFVFSFDLRWNYEWQNLILSYSAHIEVLEPRRFREMIKNILSSACLAYE